MAAAVNSFPQIGFDEVTVIFSFLTVADLPLLSTVSRTFSAAYDRIKRLPYWISSHSLNQNTKLAVNECLDAALSRTPTPPEPFLLYLSFRSPQCTTTIISQIESRLPKTTKLFGCTGSSIVATSAEAKTASLYEDTPCFSLTLISFADQCDLSVFHYTNESEVDTLKILGDSNLEQQIIIHSTPHSGGLVDPILNKLCKPPMAKSVVFGGIASGPRADAALFTTGRHHKSGVCVLIIKNKLSKIVRASQGRQLDSVVVSATTMVGNVMRVNKSVECVVGFTLEEISVAEDSSNAQVSFINWIQGVQEGFEVSGLVFSAERDSNNNRLLNPIPFDCSQGPNNEFISNIKIVEGMFIQAEGVSPSLSARNVSLGLDAIAKRKGVARDVKYGGSEVKADTFESALESAAGGGFLYSCLGRSGDWYEQIQKRRDFEAVEYNKAFPGNALSGFLAQGEIFGVVSNPPPPSPLHQEEFHILVDEMNVKSLKTNLARAKVDYSHCIEKADLQALAKVSLDLKFFQQQSKDNSNDVSFMHGYTAVYALHRCSQKLIQ